MQKLERDYSSCVSTPSPPRKYTHSKRVLLKPFARLEVFKFHVITSRTSIFPATVVGMSTLLPCPAKRQQFIETLVLFKKITPLSGMLKFNATLCPIK